MFRRLFLLLTCPLRGESRVTSSGGLIPEIDGLRFFCILAVVLFHANPFERAGALAVESGVDRALQMTISRGGAGVALFFGISGFVLGLPFLDHYRHGKPAPALGAYLLRRVLRIEPPYFICLLLLFIARAIALREDESAHLLASGFYIHNLVYGEPSTINPVAWSLEVEIQFYLVAPFLSRIFAIPGRGLRRAAIIGLGLIPFSFPALGMSPTWMDLTLPGQLPAFMVGFLSLDLYDEWRAGPRVRSVAWDALTLGGWFLVVWNIFPAARTQLIAVSCLLSLVAAFRGPLVSLCVRSPPIVGIGGMCYTIYLYHTTLRKPLDVILASIAPFGVSWMDGLLRLGIVWVFTVFASTILFLLFERPFMVRDWHKKWAAVLTEPSTWRPRLHALLRG